MIYFETIGIINGKQYKVGMNDKWELYGDKLAIDLLIKENNVDHGQLGLPPDTYDRGEYLSYPAAASQLSIFIFEKVISAICPPAEESARFDAEYRAKTGREILH